MAIFITPGGHAVEIGADYRLPVEDQEALMRFWVLAQYRAAEVGRALFPEGGRGRANTARNLGHLASNLAAALVAVRIGSGAEDMYLRFAQSNWDMLPTYAQHVTPRPAAPGKRSRKKTTRTHQESA